MTAPLRQTEPTSLPEGLFINQAVIATNWRALARKVAPATCAAVIKDNAYGLGMEAAARALSSAGCTHYFVATASEGLALRKLLNEATIYVVNGVTQPAEMAAARLTAVLNHNEDLARWRAAGANLPAWLHIDTGLNRLGWNERDLPASFEGINLQGIMSHLACSDEPLHPLNHQQLERFQKIRARFPHIKASLANSAGIDLGPDYHFDIVRPGYALYANAVSLSVPVLQIKEAAQGSTVGYGATYICKRSTRLAVLSAGYAHGLMRSLSPKGHVAFNGQLAPLAGRISMDLMVADVTDLPQVTAGDWAELIGPNLPLETQATAAGTIGYELLTRLHY